MTIRTKRRGDRKTTPSRRRLRVYAFDPSLATRLDTALINDIVLEVPWEDDLRPGPVGEYLEVVDYDPATACFYAPVDLDDPHLLARDGLAPSEGNPQFHQQMIYAVAMTTIEQFELALGRTALWAPRLVRDEGGGVLRDEYVGRLRVYPHALREANAYYSPDKKALLFGYFPAILTNPGENLPGGLVFTSLSHDVIAHETTHALLDGLHRYFTDPSNPDVRAFHEAFADVVALFQHFMQPGALRHQIARTRGDLASQNLLGQLAYQFGQAIGNHGALRDAIGHWDRDQGRWVATEPRPGDYENAFEAHDRGAILVAAMFDAFLTIYRARIADLLRIASQGSGVLPAGNLHPDLVNRLAEEATKAAGHFLRIAIRALDYCPPVDITFGEYLRAMITADEVLVPQDKWGYRIAIIEAFRRRGIYPRDVRTLAADALTWSWPDGLSFDDVEPLIRNLSLGWDRASRREEIYRTNQRNQAITHAWLTSAAVSDGDQRVMGLALGGGRDRHSLHRKHRDAPPSVEVHSVRPARRVGPDGDSQVDIVVEITQRRRGYLDRDDQRRADEDPNFFEPADFTFRGGCTLLIDVEDGKIALCISKNILSDRRLERQRRYYEASASPSLRATYFGDPRPGGDREPFAMLHRRS